MGAHDRVSGHGPASPVARVEPEHWQAAHSAYCSPPPKAVGRGVPWALLGALVILLVIELVVRRIEPRKLIAYERGVPDRFAIRQHVQAYGGAEVVFLGSSRVHLGIVVPEVKDQLKSALGREVRVENYATGGSLIQELLPMVRHMLRQRPRPRVICYGVDPEQIARDELFNERSAVYWNFSDWWAVRRELGSRVDDTLPIVARSSFADAYHTFRYRLRPLNFIKEKARGRETSPILGEYLSPEHTTDKERDLVKFPPDEPEVANHVKTVHLDKEGKYPFNERKVAMVRELAGLCRDAGVTLVLFEVPNAAVFNKYLPASVESEFVGIMRGVEKESGARFVSLEDLGLEFGDQEFRDPVHLNYAGSEKLTAALVKQMVGPVLSGGEMKK